MRPSVHSLQRVQAGPMSVLMQSSESLSGAEDAGSPASAAGLGRRRVGYRLPISRFPRARWLHVAIAAHAVPRPSLRSTLQVSPPVRETSVKLSRHVAVRQAGEDAARCDRGCARRPRACSATALLRPRRPRPGSPRWCPPRNPRPARDTSLATIRSAAFRCSLPSRMRDHIVGLGGKADEHRACRAARDGRRPGRQGCPACASA